MSTPLTWHNKRKAANMHHAAEVILDMIMEEGSLTVTHAMIKGCEIGLQTPASIYTHLKWLRDKGYVKINQQVDDARIKHCVVTSKGLKYLGVV